jgi:hypothetical protein
MWVIYSEPGFMKKEIKQIILRLISVYKETARGQILYCWYLLLSLAVFGTFL